MAVQRSITLFLILVPIFSQTEPVLHAVYSNEIVNFFKYIVVALRRCVVIVLVCQHNMLTYF